MEEGPFRMPRPADRSATSKPEPSPRPKAESPSVKVDAKPAHSPAVAHHVDKVSPVKKPKKDRSLKRLVVPFVSVVAVVAIVAAGWLGLSAMQGVGIDNSKYQAVFFTNGQVYFGRLQTFNSEYMKLTEIYYLQTQSGDQTDSKNPQKSSSDNGDVQLIKLGDEIHGPEDEMFVAKNQMLFFENLKPKGKVAQSIDQYKKTHK